MDDGIVSRFVYGPVARPVARIAGKAGANAAVLTLLALLLAIAVGGLTAAGVFIGPATGILFVGVLGRAAFELDRREGNKSHLGQVLASVAEQYTDAAILGGMTVYAVRFESHGHAELAGMLALAGALIVSFSSARIEADIERPGVAATSGLDGPFALVGRDTMLLMAAVGTVVGQCYWALVAIAALSLATVVWRLGALRLRTAKPATP